MPHRSMNLEEAAAYLHLPPAEVAKMVKRDAIPHSRQGERVVFRRADLGAWSSRRILAFPAERLTEYHDKSSAARHAIASNDALMPRLITPERIEPQLHSRTKASVLRDMVALAEKTDLVSDPRELLQAVENREELCSTAVPGGLALLHPRQHDPYMFADSFIVIGRTIQPIHFGAEDGLPTDIFFLLCCQDDSLHLHALARVCAMAQHTALLAGLRALRSANEMMAAIIGAEHEARHPKPRSRT